MQAFRPHPWVPRASPLNGTETSAVTNGHKAKGAIGEVSIRPNPAPASVATLSTLQPVCYRDGTDVSAAARAGGGPVEVGVIALATTNAAKQHTVGERAGCAPRR